MAELDVRLTNTKHIMQTPMSDTLASTLRKAGIITKDDQGSPAYCTLLTILGYNFCSKSVEDQIQIIRENLNEADHLSDEEIKEWIPYLSKQSKELKASESRLPNKAQQ